MDPIPPKISDVLKAGAVMPRKAPLRVMRCARHSEREAVARCPQCGGSFCRECVSEHEGRLLCAACLAKGLAVKPEASKRHVWKRVKPTLLNVGAVFLLWALFMSFGELLVRIPPEVHEGNIWKAPFNQ